MFSEVYERKEGEGQEQSAGAGAVSRAEAATEEQKIKAAIAAPEKNVD